MIATTSTFVDLPRPNLNPQFTAIHLACHPPTRPQHDEHDESKSTKGLEVFLIVLFESSWPSCQPSGRPPATEMVLAVVARIA